MPELAGLKDEQTGAYIENATVTAAVKTKTTQAVGQSWPLSLFYVSVSDRVYRGILEVARSE